VQCAAVELPLIRVRSSTPSEVIPVGSQEQMRDTDWPVLRMWSFFDPAFPEGLSCAETDGDGHCHSGGGVRAARFGRCEHTGQAPFLPYSPANTTVLSRLLPYLGSVPAGRVCRRSMGDPVAWLGRHASVNEPPTHTPSALREMPDQKSSTLRS